MKIAVIGFAMPSYNDAPWNDPEWEIWGMPWDPDKSWTAYDRLFEMHSPVLWASVMAGIVGEYWDGKQIFRRRHRPEFYLVGEDGKAESSVMYRAGSDPSKILYLQDGDCIPGAKTYPFDRVIKAIGADYFQSSISYIVALAITEMKERPDEKHELALHGIEVLDDEEWSYQRANLEFLIGQAMALEIKVTMSETCALLKFHDQAIKYGAIEVIHTKRYGIIQSPQVFARWTLGNDVFNPKDFETEDQK